MNARPSRETLERAVDALNELPGVHMVGIDGDLTNAHADTTGVAFVLSAGYERAPPRVLRTLAEYDLGIADVSPQGEQFAVTAV